MYFTCVSAPSVFPTKCLCGKKNIINDYLYSFIQLYSFSLLLQSFVFVYRVSCERKKAEIFFGSDRFELMAYFIGNFYRM